MLSNKGLKEKYKFREQHVRRKNKPIIELSSKYGIDRDLVNMKHRCLPLILKQHQSSSP